MTTDPAAHLLSTGVPAYCPDCAEETLFVAPQLDDLQPGEHACTVCGTAVYLDAVDVTWHGFSRVA